MDIEQYLVSFWQNIFPGSLGLIIGIIATFVLALIIMFLIPLFVGGWIDRKLAARIQSRYGPVFTGKFGLLQNLADGIKLFGKEIIRNKYADKLFLVPPAIFGTLIYMLVLIIPFGSQSLTFIAINYNILFVVFALMLIPITVILAGIFSGNKFAAISIYRSVSQFFAFDAIILITTLFVFNSYAFSMFNINKALIIYYPLTAIVFLIALLGAIERGPLDVPEASQEIVGGWRIEYSGLPYGLLILGDYTLIFLVSIFFSILFLGGLGNTIISILLFWIKTAVLFIFLLTLRWTLPRPRIDQVLNFSWKYLVPLAILNIGIWYLI